VNDVHEVSKRGFQTGSIYEEFNGRATQEGDEISAYLQGVLRWGSLGAWVLLRTAQRFCWRLRSSQLYSFSGGLPVPRLLFDHQRGDCFPQLGHHRPSQLQLQEKVRLHLLGYFHIIVPHLRGGQEKLRTALFDFPLYNLYLLQAFTSFPIT
jgi:hypothetical protein